MAKNVKVAIDSLTCAKNRVSPETYRNRLKESGLFREADIQIDHTNSSVGGDYSRNGAIMKISFEGDPSEQDGMYDSARQIFGQLKVSG